MKKPIKYSKVKCTKMISAGLCKAALISLVGLSTCAAVQNNASRSLDLDVEADFQFRTFNQVTMDLSVVDEQGMGLEGEIIRVYAINKSITSMADPMLDKRELILMTRTDAHGRAYIPVELSHSITNLMFESGGQSDNNKMLYRYDGQQVIYYQFTN